LDGKTIRNAFDFYQALTAAEGRKMTAKAYRQNDVVEMELETR